MTLSTTATLRSLIEAKGGQVFSIDPAATVFQAIALMSEKGVGALLVMAGPRLLGIISERDYTRKVILQGRSSRETRVEEIMTSHVVAANPEISVEDAMRLMTEKHIRHLPIVEDDAVIGVVSIGDLVKSVISLQQETIKHLQKYIAGGYPA